jgi:hypothetical protein
MKHIHRAFKQIGGSKMPVEAAISLSGKSCTVPFISPQTVATGQGLNPVLGSPLINDMGATFNSTEIIIPAGVSKIVMYGSIEGDVPTGETGRVNLDFLVNGSVRAGTPVHAHVEAIASGACGVSMASPPINVTAGDKIALEVFNLSGGTLTISQPTSSYLAVLVVA